MQRQHSQVFVHSVIVRPKYHSHIPTFTTAICAGYLTRTRLKSDLSTGSKSSRFLQVQISTCFDFGVVVVQEMTHLREGRSNSANNLFDVSLY